MAILGGGGAVGESVQCMWRRIVLFIQAQSWRSIGIHHNFLGWVPSASLTSHSSPHIPPSCLPSAFLSFFLWAGGQYSLVPACLFLTPSLPLLSLFFPSSFSLVCVLLHLPSSLLFQHLPASGFLPTSSFLSSLGFTHFSSTQPLSREIFLCLASLHPPSLSHMHRNGPFSEYIYIYFKVVLCGMWGLFSQTRDWTPNPCIGSVES